MRSSSVLISPALNGKVERSQKTDLEEFYPTVHLKSAELENILSEWQHYYNWFRPHGSLEGKSPDERRLELSPVTPFWDEVGKTTIRKRSGFGYKIIMRICVWQN
ncbi:MAG: integrase core domain-containing protein [Treponema sp.]|nr:integrase core domain-containing protein [Treponema sp.]